MYSNVKGSNFLKEKMYVCNYLQLSDFTGNKHMVEILNVKSVKLTYADQSKDWE